MSNSYQDMAAGPELDSLVAEALGYKLLEEEYIPIALRDRDQHTEYGNELRAEGFVFRAWVKSEQDYFCARCGSLPSYSTDPAAALVMLEAFTGEYRVERHKSTAGAAQYFVRIWGETAGQPWHTDAGADTFPWATSRAVLAARAVQSAQ